MRQLVYSLATSNIALGVSNSANIFGRVKDKKGEVLCTIRDKIIGIKIVFTINMNNRPRGDLNDNLTKVCGVEENFFIHLTELIQSLLTRKQ